MRTESTRLRRNMAWLVPLVMAPVLYVAAMLGSGWINESVARHDLATGWYWAVFLLLLFGLAAPLAALVRSGIYGHRAFRHWRRANGHYTKAEAAERQRQDNSARAWGQARAMRASLLRREVPQTIRVWDVVANANEAFFMDVPADYARHYGTDVSYSQSSGYFVGKPAFVAAGLGITALSNAARRNAATIRAAAQWRERQPCRLVVSNQRLLCQVGGRWLSFYFSAVTALYPETAHWTLVTQYDSTSPLMLSGEHVPAAALLAVLATHGPEAVGSHPGLQALGASHVTGLP